MPRSPYPGEEVCPQCRYRMADPGSDCSLQRARCVSTRWSGVHRDATLDSVRRRGLSMTTLLYTHPACLEHDPGRHHPESAARLHAVLGALADPEFAGLERREAPEAALEDLIRVHPRHHVERMLRAVPRSGHIGIDADTILSPASGEAALHAAGAVVAAVDAVMAGGAETALSAARPPRRGIMPSPRARWGAASSTTSPSARCGRARRTGSIGWPSSISTSTTATAPRPPSRTTAVYSTPRPISLRSTRGPGRRARPASATSSACRFRRCLARASSASG